MKAFRSFRILCVLLVFFSCGHETIAQNSMTGDGFGGRGWYVSHNYQAGAYAAYTVCGDSNQLFGWGANAHGELGDGTLISTITPVPIPGMDSVEFSCTGYFSVAIKKDHTGWVWGRGSFPYHYYLPTHVINDVAFADAGIYHVVFVKNDGTVWGLGQNDAGQLGNGGYSYSQPNTPVQMVGVTNAVRAVVLGVGGDSVFAQAPATLILLADGTVKITGGGGMFQINNSVIPVTLPGLDHIVDIKGNSIAGYALKSDGSVYSFGRDLLVSNLSALGLGAPTPGIRLPTRIIFPTGASSIVALSANIDGRFAMALDSIGNAYAWGENDRGQLGDGTTINKDFPTLVATNVIDIFAGEVFSYILKADNALWATGTSVAPPYFGSIWMNLPNIQRNVFTQIDPTIAPMNLCQPKVFGVVPLQLDTTIYICSNETYQLPSGAAVSTAGTYIDTIRNNTFSDSIIHTIHLIVNDFTHSNTVDSIEAGQSYTLPSGQVVNTAGIYQSVLINSLGCDSIVTTELKPKKTTAGCLELFDNAFTPNGDGINDSWVLYTYNCFRKLEVSVYNRYGSLVYQADDYKNDWKGTYKNKTLPDGTYYYIINISNVDGRTQVLKGNITIVR